MFLIGRYIVFLISMISSEIFYYKYYSDWQKPPMMKLSIMFVIQSIMILCCYVAGIYNSSVPNFMMYFANTLPLFLYNDKLKNKILLYSVVFAILSAVEILISGAFIFLLSISGHNTIFPQELAVSKSLLFFVPPILIFFINLYFANHIYIIMGRFRTSKLAKDIFIMLFSFAIIIFNESILFSSDKSNFILFTIVSLLLLLFCLFLLNKSIEDFIIKYKKNKMNRYYNYIVNEQYEKMESIGNLFKKIRMKNHDFLNHMVIIERLMINEDYDKLVRYLKKLIEKIR